MRSLSGYRLTTEPYTPPPPPPVPTRYTAILGLTDGTIQSIVYDGAGTFTPDAVVACASSNAISVAAVEAGDRGLVACYGDNGIKPIAIDTSTGALTVGSLVTTASGPSGVAVVADGSRALVSHWLSASVSDLRWNGSLWIKDSDVSVGNSLDLAIAPNGLTALVSCYSANQVKVLSWSGSAWTVTDTIVVSAGPRGVSIAPDGLTALVACNGTVDTLALSGAWSKTGTLAVGANTYHAAIAPDGLTALVACANSALVYVLSCTEGTWANAYTVDTGTNGTYRIAIAPDSNTAVAIKGFNSAVYSMVKSGAWAFGEVLSGVAFGVGGSGVCISPLVG